MEDRAPWCGCMRAASLYDSVRCPPGCSCGHESVPVVSAHASSAQICCVFVEGDRPPGQTGALISAGGDNRYTRSHRRGRSDESSGWMSHPACVTTSGSVPRYLIVRPWRAFRNCFRLYRSHQDKNAWDRNIVMSRPSRSLFFQEGWM